MCFKDKNGDRTPRQEQSELRAVQAKCDKIVDEVCSEICTCILNKNKKIISFHLVLPKAN